MLRRIRMQQTRNLRLNLPREKQHKKPREESRLKNSKRI